MPSHRVYVGTYTDPSSQAGFEVTPDRPVMGMTGPTGSEGIYVFNYDPATGAWTPLGATGALNPSFLALDRRERFLFAVNETRAFNGEETGAVSSFALDQELPRLLSQAPSGGATPCHLALSPCERYLLVADHEPGRVAVLPVDDQGLLAPPTDIQQDESIDPSGRRRPHAHFVTADPAGRFVLTTDTGTDRITIYRLDTAAGRLVPNDPPWGETHPGGGPRHLAFHPNGRFLYANGEADLTVSVFRYQAEQGVLEHLQQASTLPPGVTGQYSTAQIVVHPSGRYVYVSNRGHDSITLFAIARDSGEVEWIATEPVQGRTPRNFMIDPAGRFLFVANQNSDTIVRFTIDQATGRLTEPAEVARVPAPTCILFTQQGASEA